MGRPVGTSPARRAPNHYLDKSPRCAAPSGPVLAPSHVGHLHDNLADNGDSASRPPVNAVRPVPFGAGRTVSRLWCLLLAAGGNWRLGARLARGVILVDICRIGSGHNLRCQQVGGNYFDTVVIG